MTDNHGDTDPNDTGSGRHNQRYDQEYLNEHLESQALKPMSPFDDHDPNENWYTSTEPNLPPWGSDRPRLTYEPLPKGRWIRVLKVEPGWAYLKIRCSLTQINLDDSEHWEYEAISYTWANYYN